MSFLRYWRYPFYVMLDLVFLFLTVVVFNWWIVFFTVSADNNEYLKRKGYRNCEMLPWWLKWFDTFDASTDEYWYGNYYNEDKSVPNPYGPDNPPPFWLRKWYQIKWLYRNPMYGFSYWVTGIKFDASQWDYLYDPVTKEFHAHDSSGHFTIMKDGLLTQKLGWKTWGYFDNANLQWREGWSWGPEMRAPLGFTPLMGRNLSNIWKKLFGG
ncbi:hypothetical protein [Burkholderia phage BCSR5]|nr:hypothetical protein [Burkholderia phage BCSR5]